MFLWVIFWYLPANGIHINTGEGEQTGYITGVEKNGVIYKTYSVYIKSEVSSSQEDRYCVIDEQVVNKLKEKSISGERITIGYIEYFGRGFKNCSVEDNGIVNLIK